MPVSAEVRCLDRYSDDVAGSRRDVPIASGAHVGLDGLVGLHTTHLDLEAHRIEFGTIGHLNPGRPRGGGQGR